MLVLVLLSLLVGASVCSAASNATSACFAGTRYVAFATEVDFATAEGLCSNLDSENGDSRLATFTSSEQFFNLTAFIKTFVDSPDEILPKYWVGVKDKDGGTGQVPSRFSFVGDDQTGVEFVNSVGRGEFPWGSSQPNGQNADTACVLIRVFSGTDKPLRLDDDACVLAKRYICSSSCDVVPTPSPLSGPTSSPTSQPTKIPTKSPTLSPVVLSTSSPTISPTTTPSSAPTLSPSASPIKAPTLSPTGSPVKAPSTSPTLKPTTKPTTGPLEGITGSPTGSPTLLPTKAPSTSPTFEPTTGPVEEITGSPTESPTVSPTKAPSTSPTFKPTAGPVEGLTELPTGSPTFLPTKGPSNSPTFKPTGFPTLSPTPDVIQQCFTSKLGINRPFTQ